MRLRRSQRQFFHAVSLAPRSRHYVDPARRRSFFDMHSSQLVCASRQLHALISEFSPHLLYTVSEYQHRLAMLYYTRHAVL